MAEFDANRDGRLVAAELAGAKGLLRHDANHDSAVTPEELTALCQTWIDEKTALCATTCVVFEGKRPASGATVMYEPIAALTEQLPQGSASTDEKGAANLHVSEGDKAPAEEGLPCGFYRVRVRLADGEEREAPGVYEVASDLSNRHRVDL